MLDSIRQMSKLCADKNALFRVVYGLKLTSPTRHELLTMIHKIDDEIEELQEQEKRGCHAEIFSTHH